MANQRMAEYNCIDGVVTYKCWNEHILPDLQKQGYWDFYRETIDLYPILLYMMTSGLRVDKEGLTKASEAAGTRIEAKEAELHKLAGRPLNALSPKQCFAYFYDHLGHRPYRDGKGKPTTDDKAMARLYRKGVKEAKLVQDIRGLNKMKGTYYDIGVDPDGRVRSQFNPRGTRNARLSSSQNIFGTGMNFQNLPPEFKRYILADPGQLFVELDKDQSEWVISAYASGDPMMIAAVESGEDIHTNTAHLMFGISKELIKKEAAIIGESTDADWIMIQRREKLPEFSEYSAPRSMSCRQAGKRSNHGLNYIMQYVRFALENEMPEAEAKILVDLYRMTYACLQLWWDRVELQLRKDRIITNCFGYSRRFLDEWGNQLLKAAVSYIPQSTNVIMLNRGMKQMYYDNAASMQPISMGAQVHDSVLFQYPIDNWHNLARAVIRSADYMTPTLCYSGREFTVGTSAKIGPNWGDTEKVKITNNVTELADRLEGAYRAACAA